MYLRKSQNKEWALCLLVAWSQWQAPQGLGRDSTYSVLNYSARSQLYHSFLAISSHIFTSEITSDGRCYNGQVKSSRVLRVLSNNLPTDNTQGFTHIKPVCHGTYSEKNDANGQETRLAQQSENEDRKINDLSPCTTLRGRKASPADVSNLVLEVPRNPTLHSGFWKHKCEGPREGEGRQGLILGSLSIKF